MYNKLILSELVINNYRKLIRSILSYYKVFLIDNIPKIDLLN